MLLKHPHPPSAPSPLAGEGKKNIVLYSISLVRISPALISHKLHTPHSAKPSTRQLVMRLAKSILSECELRGEEHVKP